MRAILEVVCYLIKSACMKFLSTGLLTCLCFYTLCAQRIDSASVARLSPEKQQEVNGYLQQAKKAKTTALVLSIGGGALAIGGAVLIASSLDFSWDNGYNTDSDSKDDIGAVLFLVGAASALASIPFYIKIHKKRNAARAIIYGDRGMSFTPGVIMPATQSAGVKVIIPLGK